MNLTPPLDPSVLEQCFTLYRLSRMVFAVAQLDLATHLVAGPQSATVLAERTSTDPSTLACLLDVLTGWGVFFRDDEGRYSLTSFSQRLVEGSEGAANLPVLLGWAGFPAAYDAFGDLLYTLKTGRSAFEGRYGTDLHGYLDRNPDMRALYESAMESTSDAFERCVNVYDFSDAQCVVDVGGGQGALLREILSRHPHVTGICFDTPDVIARAMSHVSLMSLKSDQPSAGTYRDRLVFEGGNALDAVPAGGDVYVTSTVLRCFDDESCLKVLRNIRDAIVPHGRLVAFEIVLPETKDSLPHCTADLVARVVYGGRDRTVKEFALLFERAGFHHTRAIPTEGSTCLEAIPV